MFVGKVKHEHKYTLYIWSNKFNKYIICVSFSTLEKVKEFLTIAKENETKNYYCRNAWARRQALKHADLSKYYIRHTMVEIEETLLIDKVVEE